MKESDFTSECLRLLRKIADRSNWEVVENESIFGSYDTYVWLNDENLWDTAKDLVESYEENN